LQAAAVHAEVCKHNRIAVYGSACGQAGVEGIGERPRSERENGGKNQEKTEARFVAHKMTGQAKPIGYQDLTKRQEGRVVRPGPVIQTSTTEAEGYSLLML
jgi:hypothetical protein